MVGSRLQTITLKAVRDELASILLHQADQITVTNGRRAAEAFIGLGLKEGNKSFSSLSYSHVDLSRFEISTIFERAYQSVMHPGPGTVMGNEVLRLKSFIFHGPTSGFFSALCHRPIPSMKPESVCRLLTDAAYARWKLTFDPRRQFSLREVAILANLSDKEARSFASRTDDGRLRLSENFRSSVNPDDAKHWLAGQIGFRPSWVGREAISRVYSGADLGAVIRYHRIRSKKPISTTSSGISITDLSMWERGKMQYDTKHAAELARYLDFDVPLFVGKALEVWLRQEQATH